MINVKSLDLSALQQGLPAITPAYGTILAEAAAICLHDQGHQPGVLLETSGDVQETYQITWPTVTAQMLRCWADAEYATEQGAYALAFLLLKEINGSTVIRRSRRGTGYDYLIGNEASNVKDENYLCNLARLEVSGIRSGNPRLVKARVKLKLEQVKPSDGLLPAYIVVVEFSRPLAKVRSK